MARAAPRGTRRDDAGGARPAPPPTAADASGAVGGNPAVRALATGRLGPVPAGLSPSAALQGSTLARLLARQETAGSYMPSGGAEAAGDASAQSPSDRFTPQEQEALQALVVEPIEQWLPLLQMSDSEMPSPTEEELRTALRHIEPTLTALAGFHKTGRAGAAIAEATKWLRMGITVLSAQVAPVEQTLAKLLVHWRRCRALLGQTQRELATAPPPNTGREVSSPFAGVPDGLFTAAEQDAASREAETGGGATAQGGRGAGREPTSSLLQSLAQQVLALETDVREAPHTREGLRHVDRVAFDLVSFPDLDLPPPALSTYAQAAETFALGYAGLGSFGDERSKSILWGGNLLGGAISALRPQYVPGW